MTERYTPAHVCVCVGAWVRVRARVGTCARRHVRVCVCVGEGFRFAFRFAWVRACGCVRVCVCARGWGGVQGRRCFGAGAGAPDLYDTPRTQRDKLFPFTTNPKGYPLPTNPRVISSPQPNGCFPSPGWLVGWLPLLWLSLYWLPCCWVTGNRLLLVVFLWGVGVEGGGVFWVGVLFGAVG